MFYSALFSFWQLLFVDLIFFTNLNPLVHFKVCFPLNWSLISFMIALQLFCTIIFEFIRGAFNSALMVLHCLKILCIYKFRLHFYNIWWLWLNCPWQFLYWKVIYRINGVYLSYHNFNGFVWMVNVCFNVSLIFILLVIFD